MRTPSKILIAVLMASAVSLPAAVPGFAAGDEGVREQQVAHGYGYGRDRDDRRGGWERGRGGPRHGEWHRHHSGPRGPGAHAFGGPGFGGPRGGMSEALMARFDVNGDGTITKEEIDQVNAGRVASYDADGDGALSLAEFKALWADTMDLRIVRDFQALDPDGDAKVTLEEYSRRYERMFSTLDRDGNGILDEAELAGRGPGGPGPRMGPGHGPGGPGGPGPGMGPGPGEGPAPIDPEPQDG